MNNQMSKKTFRIKKKNAKIKVDSSKLKSNNNKMNILKYLDSKDIKYFDINLEINGFQKKLMPIKGRMPTTNDFDLTPLNKNTSAEYIAIDTREMLHIDVDFKDDVEYSAESIEFVESLERALPYYRSLTKMRGKHIFFKSDKKMTKKRIQTKFEDIEVLSGQWAWARKDTIMYNDDCEDYVLGDIGFLEESQNQAVSINTPGQGEQEPCNHVELGDILDNINIEYIDEYDSWSKMVWGLMNNSKTNKKLARRLSRRSDKFEEDAFLNLWNNCRSGITIATIYYYSKKSNKLAFQKIKSKYMAIDTYLGTDDFLARSFLEDNGVCYVYKHDTLYTYNRKIWSADKNNNKLCCYISTYLFELLNIKLMSLNKLISSATMENDQTKIKSLQDQRKFIDGVITSVLSTSKIVKISQRIIHLLSCEVFDHIEFDSNPYLFCFNNKCYDLKVGKWIDPRREDYILTTSRYSYEPSSENNLKELEELINQIFPDEAIKKTYVSYMATSLFGIPIEKFIIANGSGGNGKGVLNELLVECLGEYSYTAPNDLLLNSIKSGNNPAVANMNNKRLVIYREPDSENQKLCGSAIKEITGGSQINARMNYSNDTKTNLRATHILECNKKPKIDGRKDDSIERRLVDIPFKSTFTNKQELLEQDLDYVYKANIYYKSDEFKKKFKSTLFDYLINFIKGEADVCNNPYTCQEVIQRTKEYIQDSDDLYGILTESIEKTGDKNDYISCKELYNIYKTSEYFFNLAKKQKREQNYKWFRLELISNNNYRIYYKDIYKPKIDGKQINLNNVLLSHKIKIKTVNDFIEDDLN